ncbi:hypothetical protein Ct9H90mP29_06570 [bacterium]|nr:MAG: hypothetical protein Ct9H90mP29_06570 [bacterium]
MAGKRSLRQGRRIQDRLESLERKKSEWDRLLAIETQEKEEQVNALRDSIERKRTNSYNYL